MKDVEKTDAEPHSREPCADCAKLRQELDVLRESVAVLWSRVKSLQRNER